MRISDWSSDVCSSDLKPDQAPFGEARRRQPAAEIAQRDHVIPMIVHGFGDHEVEEAERLLRAVEKVQLVALDRRIERRAKFLPVREQLVARTRLEHRAGQASSEERLVGKYCARQCRSRWSQSHYKKTNN